MALYAGIDLHSNNNVVVVQDDEDNVVGRRRLANETRTGARTRGNDGHCWQSSTVLPQRKNRSRSF